VAGGCLYIPAYYWYQSETLITPGQAPGAAESIFVTFEYEASSVIVDALIKAIDGIIE